jgi:hypothetical protein
MYLLMGKGLGTHMCIFIHIRDVEREKEKEVRQEEKVGDHYTEYKNQK